MMHRMTGRYSHAGLADDPLLPETRGLQDRLSDVTWEELDPPGRQGSCRVGAYRATREPKGPLLNFRVDEADLRLLRFVGQEAAGFEVLQAYCAGLQYHWRSDLTRAFEEQTPLLSRIYGLSDRQELVVEHLVVPFIHKHRAREVRGWFTFGLDLDINGRWPGQGDYALFRRTEPARQVRLPRRLWDPERRRIRPAGLFRAVNRGWREITDRRRY